MNLDDTVPRSRLNVVEGELRSAKNKLKTVQTDAGNEIRRLESELLQKRKELDAATAELAKARKLLQMHERICDRKHAFCPDCRDKLPDDVCWRCKAQALQNKLAGADVMEQAWKDAANDLKIQRDRLKQELAALRGRIEQAETVLHDPNCNCLISCPHETPCSGYDCKTHKLLPWPVEQGPAQAPEEGGK